MHKVVNQLKKDNLCCLISKPFAAKERQICPTSIIGIDKVAEQPQEYPVATKKIHDGIVILKHLSNSIHPYAQD